MTSLAWKYRILIVTPFAIAVLYFLASALFPKEDDIVESGSTLGEHVSLTPLSQGLVSSPDSSSSWEATEGPAVDHRVSPSQFFQVTGYAEVSAFLDDLSDLDNLPGESVDLVDAVLVETTTDDAVFDLNLQPPGWKGVGNAPR